jgi:hypothetical protein
VPWWLVAMRTAMPEVTVSLEIDDSVGVTERVRGGGAELGFVEGDYDLCALHRRWMTSTVSRESASWFKQG